MKAGQRPCNNWRSFSVETFSPVNLQGKKLESKAVGFDPLLKAYGFGLRITALFTGEKVLFVFTPQTAQLRFKFCYARLRLSPRLNFLFNLCF